MLSVIFQIVLHWEVVAAFIRDVGLLLSAVMAGTLLHEKLLREQMFSEFKLELEEQLDSKVPKLTDISNTTADRVHEVFSEHPPRMTGIRLLSKVRRDLSAYYEWVNVSAPQELFFAGRSVLHRIDKDIKKRTHAGASAEDVLLQKLMAGSRIAIAFLDPRIDIIERLANEEGQEKATMLEDLATSIGICKRLFLLIREHNRDFQPGAELTIRIYDRVPYFAYHKQDGFVIVGFYFLSGIGSSSAAYEIVDEATKLAFGGHFDKILSEASRNTLVEFDRAHGTPKFNSALFQDLQTFLQTKLSPSTVAELLESNAGDFAQAQSTGSR